MDSKASLSVVESHTDSEGSFLTTTKSRSMREKLLRSHSPAPESEPKILTPEEEKAEKLRIRKERYFAEKEAKEKEWLKKEKRIDHANSSGGVYTQYYKHDNGKVNKWTMFTAMFFS